MNWTVPNNLNYNYISGYTFYKMCKWSVCPRYNQNFDTNLIEEGDLVFLNLDYAENFSNYLLKNKPKSKFNLVTQNSDRDFNISILSQLKDFCNKIYAINCTIEDDLMIKIPLGFNDQSTIILNNLDINSLFRTEKDKFVYLNFKNHHHPLRPICTNYFTQFSWVTYNPDSKFLPTDEFYKELKYFKYCVSPRGTGIDTHRIYECLLFGVLPIVKKCELNDLYEKFPIVLVDDWDQITEDFLNNNYENYYNTYLKWIDKNKNWYTSEFWIKK